MKPAFQKTTSHKQRLCELELHNQRHIVYLDLQFDHQRFDTPQSIYPVEEPQQEWVKVMGELYYLDPHAVTRADTGNKNDRVELATVSAWYYPELHRLTLWRMTGLDSLKQSHRNTLAQDANIKHIWNQLEQVLLTRFADTTEIVALARPFAFEDENRPWQAFLKQWHYTEHPSDKRRFRRFC